MALLLDGEQDWLSSRAVLPPDLRAPKVCRFGGSALTDLPNVNRRHSWAVGKPSCPRDLQREKGSRRVRARAMFVCVRIYVCACMCVCARVLLHMRVCACVCMCVRACVHVRIRRHVRARVSVRIWGSPCARMYVYVCMCENSERGDGVSSFPSFRPLPCLPAVSVPACATLSLRQPLSSAHLCR